MTADRKNNRYPCKVMDRNMNGNSAETTLGCHLQGNFMFSFPYFNHWENDVGE